MARSNGNPNRISRKVRVKEAVQMALSALGKDAKPKAIGEWLSERGRKFSSNQISNAKFRIEKAASKPASKGRPKKKRVGRPPAAKSTNGNGFSDLASASEFLKSYPEAGAALEFIQSFPDVNAAKEAFSSTKSYLLKVKNIRQAEAAIERVLSYGSG